MAYIGRRLGADEGDWDIPIPPASYDYPVYQEPENYSNFPVTVYDNWPSATTQTPTSSGGWWDTLTASLIPISQAAGNIIRAVTGQPQTGLPNQAIPAGYTRNSLGQIVPIGSPGTGFATSAQSWMMPALLGIGAVFLLSKSKKRR